MQLWIRQAAVEDICRHARAEIPNECCGLLLGGAARVDRVARARNVRASPTRFLVDPADHFAAIKNARAAGLEVMGAYHSHPASPPIPSEIDLAEASYPDFFYVIVSPGRTEASDDVRGYRLQAGNFEPVELVTIP